MNCAQCVRCGDDYNRARQVLGYQTCLQCGASDAIKEIQRKAKCTAPAYNKGAYQYVGTVEAARGVGR